MQKLFFTNSFKLPHDLRRSRWWGREWSEGYSHELFTIVVRNRFAELFALWCLQCVRSRWRSELKTVKNIFLLYLFSFRVLVRSLVPSKWFDYCAWDELWGNWIAIWNMALPCWFCCCVSTCWWYVVSFFARHEYLLLYLKFKFESFFLIYPMFPHLA